MTRVPRKQFARSVQEGVGLVELMIALVIGLILTAGVTQIFIGSKQTYRLQDGQSRLQENARFALELLSHDIRMSGFAGCANLTSITPNVIANPPAIVYSAATAVFGNDAAVSRDSAAPPSPADATKWNPSISDTLKGLDNPPWYGTDAITVQYSQGCGAHLTGNMATVNANIQIKASNSCGVGAGDALMISDCVAADVFRATSASGGVPPAPQTIAHANDVNTSNNLSKTYQQDAELFIFNSRTYYIAKGAGGQPALWRLDNNTAAPGVNNPLELVEGVEDMQILYGEDIDNNRIPNQYLTADNVTNPANIVAVRISVLVRSLDDNLLPRAQTYNYNGASVTATDRRVRRVFTTTVNLRNRSP